MVMFKQFEFGPSIPSLVVVLIHRSMSSHNRVLIRQKSLEDLPTRFEFQPESNDNELAMTIPRSVVRVQALSDQVSWPR